MLDRKLSQLKELVRLIWLFARRKDEHKRNVMLILEAYEQKERRET